MLKRIVSLLLILSFFVSPSLAFHVACSNEVNDATQFPFLNGTRTLTGIWNMGAFNVSNLLDPVSPQDAATKNYVDTHGGSNYNATYDAKPSSTYNATYDAKPSSTYNATYDAKSNYNSSYITSTYNATYDSKPSSTYNASYITSTYNATYDSKPSSTYNATYDSKPSSTYNATYDAKSNYNASYWTGTNYNASYWTGTNYNASYLISTYNATYDAKTNYNASYWTGTNYNASYLTSTYNATYNAKVDSSNTSLVLTTNTSYLLGSNTSIVTTSNTSYVETDGSNAMTGNLSYSSKYINSLFTGSLLTDAVNRSYVGQHGAAATMSNGGTVNHLMGATPTGCQVQGTQTNTTIAVTAMSSTTFTVSIFRTNSTTAAPAQTLYWECWK
jgi:hypothetical protein